MPTNKPLLIKGIQYIAWALPLFFIGPSIIYNAFQNKQNSWYYLVLIVGCLACFFAIFLTFKGLKTILKSMFEN
jgi:membrane protein DedA with SNARE-associated domain